MSNTSLRLDHWPSVVGHLSSLLDLDASAREHGALLRRRGVRSAADLLHLALLYGPGGLSLRGVARGEAAVGGALQLSLGSSQPGRMLLTSLPAERAAPDEVVRLYRMRWQVELAFKRLKSLGRFGDLQGATVKLATPRLATPRPGRVAQRRSRSPPEAEPDMRRRTPSLWRAWQAAHRQLHRALFARRKRRLSPAMRAIAKRRRAEPPRRKRSQQEEARRTLS